MRDKKRFRLLLVFIWYFILSLILYFGHKFLSVEWMIIPFFMTIVLFYFTKIDSRYLILNAILLLWLIPFLLFYRLESTADTIAIYAYYFLVSGVVLQLFLKESMLELEYIKNMFKGMEFFYLILFLALYVISNFFKFNFILKAISLCLFSFTIISMFAKYLLRNET